MLHKKRQLSQEFSVEMQNYVDNSEVVSIQDQQKLIEKKTRMEHDKVFFSIKTETSQDESCDRGHHQHLQRASHVGVDTRVFNEDTQSQTIEKLSTQQDEQQKSFCDKIRSYNSFINSKTASLIQSSSTQAFISPTKGQQQFKHLTLDKTTRNGGSAYLQNMQVKNTNTIKILTKNNKIVGNLTRQSIREVVQETGGLSKLTTQSGFFFDSIGTKLRKRKAASFVVANSRGGGLLQQQSQKDCSFLKFDSKMQQSYEKMGQMRRSQDEIKLLRMQNMFKESEGATIANDKSNGQSSPLDNRHDIKAVDQIFSPLQTNSTAIETLREKTQRMSQAQLHQNNYANAINIATSDDLMRKLDQEKVVGLTTALTAKNTENFKSLFGKGKQKKRPIIVIKQLQQTAPIQHEKKPLSIEQDDEYKQQKFQKNYTTIQTRKGSIIFDDLSEKQQNKDFSINSNKVKAKDGVKNKNNDLTYIPNLGCDIKTSSRESHKTITFLEQNQNHSLDDSFQKQNTVKHFKKAPDAVSKLSIPEVPKSIIKIKSSPQGFSQNSSIQQQQYDHNFKKHSLIEVNRAVQNKQKLVNTNKLGQKKAKKQKGWPSQSIVNQFVKQKKYYKTGVGSKKSIQPFCHQQSMSSQVSSDTFETLSISLDPSADDQLYDNKLNLLTRMPTKQNDKKIDKIYQLPLGELKASEQVNRFRKRREQEIGKARFNAKTEIKFREMYEGRLPEEFDILTEPATIFQEFRAKELIDHIVIQNEQQRLSSLDLVGRGGLLKSIIESTQGGKSGEEELGNDGYTEMGGTSRKVISTVGTAFELKSQYSTSAFSQQRTVGLMSNNLRRSHVMKLNRLEHKKKSLQQERIHQKLTHYMMKPEQSIKSRSNMYMKNINAASRTSQQALDNSMVKDSSFLAPSDYNQKQQQQQQNFHSVPQLFVSKLSTRSDTTSEAPSRQQQINNIKSNSLASSAANSPNMINEKINRENNNFNSLKLQKCSSSQGRVEIDNKDTTGAKNGLTSYVLGFVSQIQDFVTKRSQQVIQDLSGKEVEQCITVLEEAIKLSKLALDMKDTLHLYKLIVFIKMSLKQFKSALEISQVIILMCHTTESLQEMRLEVLKLAAKCQMGLLQFDEAIHGWKLCYEHALRTQNEGVEMEVYEQLSNCYFYLGQMKKSEYFNTRFRMGVYEPQDSYIRKIYTSLRKNSEKIQAFKIHEYIFSATENNGICIFQSFYQNVRTDQIKKAKLVNNIILGKSKPKFQRNQGKLTRRIGAALLLKVGQVFRQIYENKIKLPEYDFQTLFMTREWRESYEIDKHRAELDDLIYLRANIYKVCETQKLAEFIPEIYQHEIDLIDVFVQSNANLRYEYRENRIVFKRQTTSKETVFKYFPTPGQITMQDYDLLELPAPAMTEIEAVRFDYRNPIKVNETEQNTYQREMLEMLCPHLFKKKYKKPAIPRQWITNQQYIQEQTESSINERVKMKFQKENREGQVVFSNHLSKERQVGGFFKSEDERIKFQTRDFITLQKMFGNEIEELKAHDPSSGTDTDTKTQRESKDENHQDIVQSTQEYNDDILDDKPISLQNDQENNDIAMMKHIRNVLVNCLPIRAYIYGQELTQELINDHNKLVSARIIIKNEHILRQECTDKSKVPSERQSSRKHQRSKVAAAVSNSYVEELPQNQLPQVNQKKKLQQVQMIMRLKELTHENAIDIFSTIIKQYKKNQLQQITTD